MNHRFAYIDAFPLANQIKYLYMLMVKRIDFSQSIRMFNRNDCSEIKHLNSAYLNCKMIKVNQN